MFGFLVAFFFCVFAALTVLYLVAELAAFVAPLLIAIVVIAVIVRIVRGKK